VFSDNFGTSRITIQSGLRWVLITQAILAVFLVLSDVKARWLPRLGGNDALPTGPATPGDQVRRYDPARTLPDFTDKTTLPNVALPSDLPTRLQFEFVDAGKFGEAVLINGPIERGDARRFANYLASLDELPDWFALNSPGGFVSEALAIGRSLREAKADTAVWPGMACLSSCPYILAAGVERSVSTASAVGMHQHYYEAPGYMPVFLAVEGIQHGLGLTMEYLIEMGIDPLLMLYSLNTRPDEIYILVKEELLDSQLATVILE